LAKLGHRVIGCDVDFNKVSRIAMGLPTIVERDIDEVMMEGFKAGLISATSSAEEAVLNLVPLCRHSECFGWPPGYVVPCFGGSFHCERDPLQVDVPYRGYPQYGPSRNERHGERDYREGFGQA